MINKNNYYNNYHNLPSTKCDDRMYDPKTENLLNNKNMKTICSGLNPNNVYNTFFGKHINNKYEKTPFNKSSKILHTSVNPSLNKCSKNCSNNKQCKSFSYEDNTKCYLYKHQKTVPTSKAHINYKKSYENNIFKMNKLKNPNEKIVGQHYAQYVATQDECNKKCINDDNCASYNLELNQNYCNLYSSNDKVKTKRPNISLYSQKDDTSFTIPDVYKQYYEKYPQKGNKGDYFCKYSNNKCNYISKNDPKSKIKPLKPIPEDPCIPPNCYPSDKKNKKKIYINGVPFYNNNCKGLNCLNQQYYINKLGVADLSHQPNPSAQSSLYINHFKDPINDKTYANCPKNYTPIPYVNPSGTSQYVCQNEKLSMCQPDSMDTNERTHLPSCDPIFSQEHQPNPVVPNKPSLKYFQDPNKCKAWCFQNPKCTAAVLSRDLKGDLLCRYYSFDPTKISPNVVSSKLSTIHVKDGIYNSDNIKEKAVTQDKCGLYGCCASGIPKKDAIGSNCELPCNIGGGCITGGIESKTNNRLFGGDTSTMIMNEHSGSSYTELIKRNEIEHFSVKKQGLNFSSVLIMITLVIMIVFSLTSIFLTHK